MATEEIRAMLPGIFYRRPSPDQPPYKNDGGMVAKGDVIGLIEVMKSFHEVHSTVDGTIIAFKVGNAEPISPGTILAEVET